MKCPICKGNGTRIMSSNNIRLYRMRIMGNNRMGLCLKCLGGKEINEDELNNERFYRNIKKAEIQIDQRKDT